MADQGFDPYVQWQAPSQVTTEDRRLGWLRENIETGETWLKSQRGASDFKRALDVISGKLMTGTIPQYRSQLNTNHLKRNMREIIGTLAKLRPLWGYSSDNSALAAHAQQMNLLTKAIYLEQSFDLSIKEALQYAAATCTGWVRPIYSRDLVTGEGNIQLLTYGSPCILPVQLPASGDFQKAYTVTIRDEMPIYMAHSMFPLFQHRLRPTSSLYWYSSDIRRSSQGNSANIWQRVFGKASSAGPNNMPDLMIPVGYTYIIDLSCNTTTQSIPMGEPGTTWAYVVKPGERLYPRRRLIIWSESCIMYDGPSFDWHGRAPVIPFSLDRWPWEPLGFSPVRDGYDIQTTINEQERGMADKKRAQLDMPLAYDINSVTKREASQFDPMQPRSRVGFDGSQIEKPFQMPIPPEVLMLDQTDFAWLDHLKLSMDEQHAIKDMMALAQARMAGDDIDKLLQASGPIVEDMSRSMEPPMRELADQVKYLILQYLPPARVLQIVGDDNITMDTFDYDPSSLVPSHMPGEDPGTDDAPKPSATSKLDRARYLASNLRFIITPRSLHELTQMAMKLGLIQLKKAAVKIDSQTIADSWSVPNYGNIPGSTVMEKFKHEQEEDLMQAARMKAYGAALEAEVEGGAGAGGGDGAPPASGGSPASGGNEGRPPSGQEAPALKQKSDGRSTITESKGGGKTV